MEALLIIMLQPILDDPPLPSSAEPVPCNAPHQKSSHFRLAAVKTAEDFDTSGPDVAAYRYTRAAMLR